MYYRATLFQNLYAGALVLTSATFVSAIYNLIPAITFVLATPFGYATAFLYIFLNLNCLLLYRFNFIYFI